MPQKMKTSHPRKVPFEVEVVISVYATNKGDAYDQVLTALQAGLRGRNFIVWEATRATMWDPEEWDVMREREGV